MAVHFINSNKLLNTLHILQVTTGWSGLVVMITTKASGLASSTVELVTEGVAPIKQALNE